MSNIAQTQQNAILLRFSIVLGLIYEYFDNLFTLHLLDLTLIILFDCIFLAY